MNNEGGSLRSLLNSGEYNVLSITDELAETAFLNINRPEDLAGIKNREDNNG